MGGDSNYSSPFFPSHPAPHLHNPEILSHYPKGTVFVTDCGLRSKGFLETVSEKGLEYIVVAERNFKTYESHRYKRRDFQPGRISCCIRSFLVKGRGVGIPL